MGFKLFLLGVVGVIISTLLLTAKDLQFSSIFSTKDTVLSSDHGYKEWKLIPIDGAIGPESFAFDARGEGPYTGVSDGRIIKWVESERKWVDFATTSATRDNCGNSIDNHAKVEHICGRPLGLSFNKATGDLYVADAYKGLLVVGAGGGLATSVATEAQGVPFRFTNGLDIDPETGYVYFTDSSSTFQRRNFVSVILSGDTTGRLMKFNPTTKQVTILLDNLTFPNGVALSKDGESLLLVETSRCRILKYWLKTPKAGKVEVFATLPGYPDNIRRSPRGGFWVGIHSMKQKLTEWILSHPWMGKLLVRTPIDIVKIQAFVAKWGGRGVALRLSEEGEVIEVFEGANGNRWGSISELEEIHGNLWIGSINQPFAGVYKK